jgi:hypothetical protein
MRLSVCRLFLVGLIFMYAPCYGQVDAAEVLKTNTTCEENIAALEEVMRKSSEDKGIIFLVSHSAKTERNGMDWSRLKYTRTALTNFRKFPADRLKLLVGEPTEEEFGKLEFWVNGDLRLISYSKKNQRACFHI